MLLPRGSAKTLFHEFLVDEYFKSKYGEGDNMTKLHYIYDEDLKVEREYVEVDREARTGDYVISKWSGNIHKVTEIDATHALITTSGQLGHPNGFYHGMYTTLSPTNIVRIDGERYEMVARKAEVGEKVMYVYNGKSDGIVTKCTDVGIGSIDVEEYRNTDDGAFITGIDHGAYKVLVPVVDEADEAEEEQAQESDVERLTRQMTSLAASYAKLKREVAELQVESISEESSDSSTTSPETDAVNSPSHYTQGGVEVIDYIDQVAKSYSGKQSYYAGNIIKYVSRAPHKNGVEDIRKAVWYAERLAESMQEADAE